VLHDGVPYDLIILTSKSSQGHGSPKVVKTADFKVSAPLLCM